MHHRWSSILIAAVCMGSAMVTSANDEELPAQRPSLVAVVADQCDLVVDFGEESQSCWSHVCKSATPVELGCDLSAMRQVGDVSVSPDRKWLAVISVGEGHPMLEVLDLGRLLEKHEYAALTTINPYPGTINLHGWREGALLVTSDVPLPEMPLTDGDIFDLMSDHQKLFAVDLTTWKIQAETEPATR